jgi:hypothetical protein
MYLAYRDLEIALSSKSYFDHVFNGLIIKRYFWAYPLMAITLPVIFHYIFSGNISKITPLLFIFPLITYSVLALIIGFIERKILTGFLTLSKEDKIKTLKKFFFISGTFISFSYVLIIINNSQLISNNHNPDMWYFSWLGLISIMGMLLISIFLSFISNSYNKALPDIEKKGLLDGYQAV